MMNKRFSSTPKKVTEFIEKNAKSIKVGEWFSIDGEDYFICSICGQLCKGLGNNAEPVNSGRCCDNCDELVIRRRIAEGNLEYFKSL